MELILFISFVFVALVLVALGLFFSDHTEVALLGFLLFFLVGMIMLTGTITHKVGTENNITCAYSSGNLTGSSEQARDIYEPISWDGNFSHTLGYFMVIAAIAGFIGCASSIKKFFMGD